MSKTQWRSIGLVLSFVLGFAFYEQLAGLRWVTPYSIGLMLFFSFIGLDVAKLRPQKSHLRLMLFLQLSWLLAWGIPALCGYPMHAEAFFFCAAAPIATASPVIISLMKGRVEYMTTAMLLSHITFILIIPLVLPFVVQAEGSGYFELVTMVLRQVGLLLLLPFLMVVIIRALYPKSKAWGGRLGNLSLLVWIFNLTIITASGVENISSKGLTFTDIWPLAAGAAVICALGFFGGYRLGRPELSKEFSQGLGQKNTILTLFIASQPYAHPLAYVAPAFYVIFHNMANAVQISLAARRQRRGE